MLYQPAGWGKLCILAAFENVLLSNPEEVGKALSEPPLDRHVPVFTGKCFPSTDEK